MRSTDCWSYPGRPRLVPAVLAVSVVLGIVASFS
jgi:hypothetical protein